ncbi:MAG: hypothetical protein AVDCRST_MAG69-1177, partial [uncultured Solirubrobacteraceae bacterium]
GHLRVSLPARRRIRRRASAGNGAVIGRLPVVRRSGAEGVLQADAEVGAARAGGGDRPCGEDASRTGRRHVAAARRRAAADSGASADPSAPAPAPAM